MLETIHSDGWINELNEDAPTTAVLFPGQGSQQPEMGQAFYDAWPATREWFDTLSAAVDIDVRELCFDGDHTVLTKTENTQPCVYTTGVATFAGLADRHGIVPDYVAGHSLGHFSALTAAGGLDPETGVGLVRERGRQMQQAAEQGAEGEMMAVLCRDTTAVEQACDRVEGANVAARNTDSQTVVSGPEPAVSQVRDRIDDETRARFTTLDVGAAFHSGQMETAATAFTEKLAETSFERADIPVVSDVSGDVYHGDTQVVQELGSQVVGTVDWCAVVETLAGAGVERYIEMPPAGTLTGFIERLCPEAETIPLESPADAAEVFGA
ncbi:ACP S-malonyltransferase [Haloarcula salinisoli]|uniref:[acyl-carrier-protein] S-malonyltransferase n=1 Tax=Haloarcula salinisoli TaxID=2487746 RepID=A0A8J8CEU1_9EURY|nr:ACP S-malonyltransferase [Halomicroarcula salinisoli]MBX0288652.1 ACP S-malonyltransferase [Halomicroarcula salinisoli]MBX0306055.1 ACP S-malonyltransferase [Halomicroarcula salinisoli]